jgi:3-polyprenyl-4-hydroxybenzoate decarboxylase
MEAAQITVAITGASGAIFGREMLPVSELKRPNVWLHLVRAGDAHRYAP